jgi:ribose-phosphate pyrophosphokinase
MPVKIFSTSKSSYLAKKIADSYGIGLSRNDFKVFSDGEFCPMLDANVRGDKVFIISSLFSSYHEIDKILKFIPEENHKEATEMLKKIISSSDSVFELLQMIDAAKRASAKDIVAVIPYFGWARQDRKDKPRVPITAKLLANLITKAGATRVITIDLHADQIQGFFDIPVDALQSSYIFMPYIENLGLKNLVMGSPDEGGGKRVKPYAEYFKTRMIFMYKERSAANMIEKMELIGDVNGCDVVFIDDIIDTAGTITLAADILMNKKGAKSVRACIPHAVLSGPAFERIENSKITEIILTDTIPMNGIKSDKIKVVSVADLIAKAIYRMNTNESISNLFKKKIN